MQKLNQPSNMLTRINMRQVAWSNIPSSALHIVSQDHASPFSKFWTGTFQLAVPDGLRIFMQCWATRPTVSMKLPFQLPRFPTTAKQLWIICVCQHLDSEHPAIFVKLPCACRKSPPKVSHAASSFLSVSLWIEAGIAWMRLRTSLSSCATSGSSEGQHVSTGKSANLR